MDILQVLVISSFLVWVIWLYADPRPFHVRLTNTFLLAIGIMAGIVLPQVLSYLYFPLPRTGWDDLIVYLGIAIFFLGLFFCVWAKLTMRRYWGASAEHELRKQDRLLTHGPFAYSRNPISLGIVLLVFGFSVALRSSFLLLPILLFVYFEDQVKKDERFLKHKFGEKYEKYCKRVPRFIGYKRFSL